MSIGLYETCRRSDGGSLDFTFPQEFQTVLEASETLIGSRFEIRRFDWSERNGIVFTPPCSYFELTRFPSAGRYSASASVYCAQGEVRFYPVARTFEMYWQERVQRSLFCRIDIPAITGLPIELSDQQLQDTIDMRNPHLRALLLRAQQELTAPGLCSHLVLESISAGLAAEMIQRYGPHEPATRGERRALDARYLAGLVTQIREQPGRVEIAILAAERGISVRHYERLFHAATGESPLAFCRRHMLALAKDLLMDRSLLIKEIAYRCGFANTASFSVAFRHMAGSSPQQYRDRRSFH